MDLRQGLRQLQREVKKIRDSERFAGRASHRVKRAFVSSAQYECVHLIECTAFQISSLGLREKPVSVQDLLDASDLPGMAGHKVKIVYRARSKSSPVRLRVVLTDTKCRDADDFVVDSGAGFYIVEPEESVIFISEDNSKLHRHSSCNICTLTFSTEVELVVLRGVARSAQNSELLYRWASEVVSQACAERRDVRVRPFIILCCAKCFM
jgi:hypothetical protein